MKKIFLLVMAFVLLFALCSCGGEPISAPEAAPVPTPEAAAQPVETAEPEPSVDPDSPEGRAAALGLPAPPDIDINSWEYIVANSYNSITEYSPEYGGIEGQGIDIRIYDAAHGFLDAARQEGYSAYIAVAYRNYEYLLHHYHNMVAELGGAVAASSVYCGPGTNDHQTGLAIDLTDQVRFNATYDNYFGSGMEDSELYEWALEHCTEYGFIVRFPEGKEEYYGTPCCTGHFRYVGVEAAEYITENELCLEEFLLLYDENAVFVPDK